MAKLLRCGSRQCAGREAMLPASPAYPNGEPYITATHVGRYSCARCKRATTLDVVSYNRLPQMKLEDFSALARTYGASSLSDLPTRDLVGAGFEKAQAADLFRAGFEGAHELAALERGAA